MDDDLEPGVDKPRGWQYLAGVVVILLFSALLWRFL
jgi:hypothetical protein